MGMYDKSNASLVSSGDINIPTLGPTVPKGTRLAEYLTERLTQGLGYFLESEHQLYSFSHISILNLVTVRYGTVQYLLVTSLRSMFTVDDARCLNQLETANIQHIEQ